MRGLATIDACRGRSQRTPTFSVRPLGPAPRARGAAARGIRPGLAARVSLLRVPGPHGPGLVSPSRRIAAPCPGLPPTRAILSESAPRHSASRSTRAWTSLSELAPRAPDAPDPDWSGGGRGSLLPGTQPSSCGHCVLRSEGDRCPCPTANPNLRSYCNITSDLLDRPAGLNRCR